MRHVYANRAAYIIAALLVFASLVFAWIRSAQWVIADERALGAQFVGLERLEDFDWEALGEYGYMTNCRNCHGERGEGYDAYPPLRGVGAIFAAGGGRDYLVDVHLYGLTSSRTTAPMPPFYNVPDATMAALINYTLTRWGNEAQLPEDAQLYLPRDIAARRGQGLSPWDVNARRAALDFGGPAAVAGEVIASAGFDWQGLGASVFDEHCSGCHVQVAQAPRLLMAEGGRDYLVNLLLFGAEGEVRHPAYDELSDEEIAASLNHSVVHSTQAGELPDDAQLIRIEDIREARGRGLSPGEVGEQRPAIAEPEEDPAADPAPPEEELEDEAFEWRALGEESYDQHCSGCHGEGRFLAHMPELFAAEGGRDYLAAFMLYGLEGEIVLEDAVRNSSHPAFGRLADDEVAAILNHTLTSWNHEEQLPADAALFVPEEVAEQRERELSPQEVHGLREDLNVTN